MGSEGCGSGSATAAAAAAIPAAATLPGLLPAPLSLLHSCLLLRRAPAAQAHTARKHARLASRLMVT